MSNFSHRTKSSSNEKNSTSVCSGRSSPVRSPKGISDWRLGPERTSNWSGGLKSLIGLIGPSDQKDFIELKIRERLGDVLLRTGDEPKLRGLGGDALTHESTS
jgi:hypothetical protein